MQMKSRWTANYRNRTQLYKLLIKRFGLKIEEELKNAFVKLLSFKVMKWQQLFILFGHATVTSYEIHC